MNEFLTSLKPILHDGWAVFKILFVLIGLGELSFYTKERLKARDWKGALKFAALFIIAVGASWLWCNDLFAEFSPKLPPVEDTAFYKWFATASIGIKWQTCAKILGGLYIAALWAAFAVIWRIVFKRVRRIRSKITNKQDMPAVIGMAVICLFTAAIAFLISSTIWKAAVEVGNVGPEEPATVGKVLLMTFFALLWGRVIAALGISTHKSIHRGRRRDYAELALSVCLVVAVSYISWLLVPTI